MSDDTPTSFDALAHEHNLSHRMRDLCREFFKLGVTIGKRQNEAMNAAAKRPTPPAGCVRRESTPPDRPYHHITDRDTAPGEFR